MQPITVGYIGIIILVIFLFSGMPIGFVMLLVGAVGTFYLVGWESGLGMLRAVPYRNIASYSLSVVPLFVLMGTLCFHAGISKDLYYTVYRWLGHRPGGLAMASVGACAGFAAVSGSSVATAATMGMVSLPEMRRYNYDDSLATGAIAAGGTIGSLIPPSVALIIYGIIAQQSIGKLFMAGFIPGLLEALFYMVTIYLLCQRNPSLGPRAPKTSFAEKLVSLKDTWIVVILFLIVLGGIYFGIFTPTEAAGVGAFGAFLFALGRRRLTWNAFFDSISESVKTTAMIFVVLIGAMVFCCFLALTKLPWVLAETISALAVNRYIVLTAILVSYVFLGCIMEPLGMTLLTVPIFLPVVQALGFDPILFGILVVRTGEMGMITPPVGINVFVIKGVAKDVPLGTIFRGIVPFFIADIFHVALLVAVPQISLFLPSLAY